MRQISGIFLNRKPVVLIITKCPPGEPVRCHHRVKHPPAAALLLSWPAASLSAASGQSGRRPLVRGHHLQPLPAGEPEC